MKRLPLLGLLLLLSSAAIGQTISRVQVGSLTMLNTIADGTSYVVVYLNDPSIASGVIDDLILTLNGVPQHTKPSLGPITLPTSIEFAGSSTYALPPAPYYEATVQIHFANNALAPITLASGQVVTVFGIATTGMVPSRGNAYLNMGTATRKGQSVPLYLPVKN